MKSGSLSSYRAALSGTGADFGGERDDEPSEKPTGVPDNTPTRPGFYWARWTSPARGTFEAEEMGYPQEWEVVEVWENFIGDPCEADRCEKFGVSVPGVRETQWLRNFEWGERVPRFVARTPHEKGEDDPDIHGY